MQQPNLRKTNSNQQQIKSMQQQSRRKKRIYHRVSQKQRIVRRNIVIVSILVAIIVFIYIFVFNFLYLYRTHPDVQSSNNLIWNDGRNKIAASLRQRKSWISLDAQPFNEDHEASNAHHLIMVAGHSVTISGHLEDADVDESDWWLFSYQKHKGLPQAIVEHIKAGIKECYNDPDSLLIFSGGETRARTGPLTEGSSYFQVADAMDLWSTAVDKDEGDGSRALKNTVRSRTVTEEYATDSFQNLLYSICRFYEITNRYPSKITVVSFSFKKQRFQNMHANALRYPMNQFHYIGYDPSPTTGFNLAEATKGELENAAKPFETDPYGCHSSILQKKRRERNPFSRKPPYELTCPDMKTLLDYCGETFISEKFVPWT